MLLKGNPKALEEYRARKAAARAKVAKKTAAQDRAKAAHNAGTGPAPKGPAAT
jgi:hypothetical protein